MTPLQVGEVIQRGDVFVDEGREFPMDRLGRVLGVQVIGETVTRDNVWFRPDTEVQSAIKHLRLERK